MSDRVKNVLFLCTGNSARSIFAEALLARWGVGRYRAFSAGSRPRGEVHPLALETLRANGHVTEGLRSKSWDEFALPGAPAMDVVITVCGNAAREACPAWPGRPAGAHWEIDDPAEAVGSDEEKRRAFRRAYLQLEGLIRRLSSLPVDELDRADLAKQLDALGRTPPVAGS